MPTMDETRPSAESLQQRIDFETLLSELSSRFIHLPAGKVDREIVDALRSICEPLGIGPAIPWQWSQAAPDLIVPTHVYHAHGVPRPSGPMSQDQYPWSRQQLLAGRRYPVTEKSRSVELEAIRQRLVSEDPSSASRMGAGLPEVQP